MFWEVDKTLIEILVCVYACLKELQNKNTHMKGKVLFQFKQQSR